MKAGVIFKTKFVGSWGKAFKEYIEYIDRSEAVRGWAYHEGKMTAYGGFEDYTDYMANPEKSTGLFTEDKDEVTAEGKKELKDIFQSAQEKGSLMYQSIFSFDKEWLLRYGLIDEAGALRENKLREFTRASMAALLKKEGMEDFIWSASMHYNTKHFHIHIAMVCPNPSWEEGRGRCRRSDGGRLYQRGKLKQKSIEAAKSRFINLAIGSEKENAMINDIIRNRIVAGKKQKQLSKDMLKLGFEFNKLLKMLPHDMRMWRYNMAAISDCRGQIDHISNLFIDRYFKEDIRELEKILQEQSAKYRESYGDSRKADAFKTGAMKDLYERLGNSILAEARQIEKQRRLKTAAKKGYDERHVYHGSFMRLTNTYHSINQLRKILRKDLESVKNQAAYERLQKEAEYEQNLHR